MHAPARLFYLTYGLLIVALVRLGLTFLTYRRVRQLFPSGGGREPASMAEMRKTAWVVTAASRIVPGATCLTQAIAGQHILSRYGKSSEIRIGVHQRSIFKPDAHAWLISGRHIVLGGAAKDFPQFSFFPVPDHGL